MSRACALADGLDPEAASAALRVIQKVACSKSGVPFSAPVSEQDVPGYRAIVKKPMDLGTIAQHLENGHYRSLGAQLEGPSLTHANCHATMLRACDYVSSF